MKGFLFFVSLFAFETGLFATEKGCDQFLEDLAPTANGSISYPKLIGLVQKNLKHPERHQSIHLAVYLWLERTKTQLSAKKLEELGRLTGQLIIN